MTAQCQRTKKRSFGVNTDWSNTSNGVSSSGGRLRCRMSGPFCGKAVVIGRLSGPPGSGSVIIVSANAGLDAAARADAPASLRKRRRDEGKPEGSTTAAPPTKFGQRGSISVRRGGGFCAIAEIDAILSACPGLDHAISFSTREIAVGAKPDHSPQ